MVNHGIEATKKRTIQMIDSDEESARATPMPHPDYDKLPSLSPIDEYSSIALHDFSNNGRICID